ncbi:hypothetical protein [Xanthomonas oryzae]|nr:hypothetical protein [Xanthomonas oryzae]QEO95373.1 hypothetical protein XOCgx_0378 [Xanthomonas oryzae pv. oryzicola]
MTVCDHGERDRAPPPATDGDDQSAGVAACVAIIVSALCQVHWARRSAVAP